LHCAPNPAADAILNSFLICDDHALVREAVAGTLLGCWPESAITEAGDFKAAWSLADQGHDLCICDLMMPGAEPLEGVARIKQLAPDMPVLILTGTQDDALMLRLLELGVNGFVQKDVGGKVMLAAIHLIAAGERHVPSRLLTMMAPASPPTEQLRLTDQQRKVVALVAQGQSNKAIALALGVAPSTIKTHLEQAMRQLGATSRYEAANLARAGGLI
jgi:two-component system, NarL family, nitrate/nitrite response regulator NarL